jgi:hypothetical protein
VDRTGSELCPIARFYISDVKPLGSATRELVSWLKVLVVHGCDVFEIMRPIRSQNSSIVFFPS